MKEKVVRLLFVWKFVFGVLEMFGRMELVIKW